jgi:hypothetical protein
MSTSQVPLSDDALSGRRTTTLATEPSTQEQGRQLPVIDCPHGNALFIPPLVREYLLDYANRGGDLVALHATLSSLMVFGANNDVWTAILRNGYPSPSGKKIFHRIPHFETRAKQP